MPLHVISGYAYLLFVNLSLMPFIIKNQLKSSSPRKAYDINDAASDIFVKAQRIISISHRWHRNSL